MNLKTIEMKVIKKLSNSRYVHSKNTAKLAMKISRAYNVSENDAYIAGILHDYGKGYSKEELLELAKKYNLILNKQEMSSSVFLHGIVGAEIARNEFFIKNDDIINAIKYHTMGRENMSLLEKIIFLADYLEIGRKHIPEFEMSELRELALTDIDKTVLIVIDKTLKYLIDNNKIIHMGSIEAWNYLINNKKGVKKCQ